MSLRRRSPAALFNGVDSYATIPSWTPTGKFGVFAQFSGAVPTSVDAYLLVDATGRNLAVRGPGTKSQFASSYPGSAAVLTPSNGLVGMVVEAGKMYTWDGATWTTATDAAIVTTYTYTTIGKRGTIFSPMALQWMLLYDYATPSNSRHYVAQQDGSLLDILYGGVAATGYNLSRVDADRGVWTPAAAMHEVKTATQWETKYLAHYSVNFPCYQASPTIQMQWGEEFSWSGQYWLQTYILMHKTTGNVVYLDRAKVLIDYMFNNTDKARFDRGEIFCADNTGTGGIDDRYNDGPPQYRWVSDGGGALQGVAAKGWRRKNGALWQTGPLLDGAITSGIAKYCHYVLSRPTLSSRHVDALAYLSKCAEIIHDHDLIWSDTKQGAFQSYFFLNGASNSFGDAGKYGNPVAFNHTFVCCVTMAICNVWLTVDASFSDKISKTLSFWRLYRWRETRGGWHWWYAFDTVPSNRKAQDINHAGNLEVTAFYWLTRLGYMTETELKQCVKGFVEYAELNGSGAARYRIDGSYKSVGDAIAGAADASCLAQNCMVAATVDQSLISLARRIASIMLVPTLSWPQWGTFSAAAYDIAAKSGTLDVAAT